MSSCSVMPLSAVMGTLCTHMCSSSVAAGCWLGGSLLSSCKPLASTHTSENPTVLVLTASFSADLLKLDGS